MSAEGELCIERSTLIQLLQSLGPDNERIRDRLIAWAETVKSFQIQSVTTHWVGGASTPNLDDWREQFEDYLLDRVDVSDEQLNSMIAKRLGITGAELAELNDEQFEDLMFRRRFDGLTVVVRDS